MVLSVGFWARIPQTVASRQSQRWWVALGGKANTGHVSEILWTMWQERKVSCPVGQRRDRSSAPPGRLSLCETASRHRRRVEPEGHLSPSSLYSVHHGSCKFPPFQAACSSGFPQACLSALMSEGQEARGPQSPWGEALSKLASVKLITGAATRLLTSEPKAGGNVDEV